MNSDVARVMHACLALEAHRFILDNPELRARMEASASVVSMDEIAELLAMEVEHVEAILEDCLAQGWLVER